MNQSEFFRRGVETHKVFELDILHGEHSIFRLVNVDQETKMAQE